MKSIVSWPHRRTHVAFMVLVLSAVVGLAPVDADDTLTKLAYKSVDESPSCAMGPPQPGHVACLKNVQADAPSAAFLIAAMFTP
ncbi:hypothetical protein SAMN05444004_10698 [Jannaschia faecimaris]|uniref:Uncharacterized protein n=1 Tax=Jannaschia faecimaris TaxID=1244108 RepID=A0A1H3QE08_9RHOB|nr:hypothetical protein SAMN05444004_10698 [Jannaschia faecimaris]